MNIDNLIREILKKNGSISKADINILITNILQCYFDKENISYDRDINTKTTHYDFILASTFKDLLTPSGIKVDVDLRSIFTSHFETLNIDNHDKNQYEKLKSTIYELISTYTISSIAIVTFLNENEIKDFELKILDLPKNFNIKILGKDFINEIIQLIPNKVEEIVNKLFSFKINNLVFTKNDDWKIKSHELLQKLKLKYRDNEKLSLLLGAGVSCSADLPNWDELISSLFTTYLVNSTLENTELKSMSLGDYKESINHISKSISGKYIKSALLSARYLQKGFATQENETDSFLIQLQKCLYKNQIKKSSLITAIGKLCIPTRIGAKINSIVTYNFDNLIEIHLDRLNLKYKSIFLDNVKYQNEELPIYHVHGYIPQNIDLTKSKEIFQDIDLIFSESGYHRMYSNPYHWSNLIQLSTLKENTCIMIGLSLDDPNLRRLLEIAQTGSNISKHFAFLRRINIEEFAEANKSLHSISLQTSFLERHHNLQELMFSELGINVISFEEFEELPKLLNQLLN